MFVTFIYCLLIINTVENAVLDPALYLSPSPPLKDTTKDILPTELWTRTVDKTVECSTSKSSAAAVKNIPKDSSEIMEESETFWPFIKSPEIKLGDVHIPLTYSVSGTYDKLHSASGVISTSYMKIPSSSSVFGNYGKSGLAGSDYGKYPIGYPNVKIYASSNQPTWGGWGNGKWGNYGKG